MQFSLSFGFLLVGTAVNESQSVISLYLSIYLSQFSLSSKIPFYYYALTHTHSRCYFILLFFISSSFDVIDWKGMDGEKRPLGAQLETEILFL